MAKRERTKNTPLYDEAPETYSQRRARISAADKIRDEKMSSERKSYFSRNYADATPSIKSGPKLAKTPIVNRRAKAAATKNRKTEVAKSQPSSPRSLGAENPTMKSFSEAFQDARQAGQKTFTYDGKQFAAVTKEEVEDKGFTSLRDYLNEQFKSRIV
jgi:hypothetical protein